MTKDFSSLHPINLDFDFANTSQLVHYPMIYPTWPDPGLHLVSNWPAPGFSAEMEFTGWRDEGMAKHLTVSISNYLTPVPPTIRLKGSGALKFLSENLVNSFAKFPIGSAKHAIMCNDDGNMIFQGILYRLSEDEFETHCLMTLPYILSKQKKQYDMTVEDITMKRFMMQTSGLRSLELFEELTGEDLHDIKYCHFRECRIDGKPVRIYRFGMTGSLGYEVTGNMEDGNAVYRIILEIGNKYGIRRMGAFTYVLNHTPGGFLQYGMHYLNAIMDEKDYQEAMSKENGVAGLALPIRGSFDGPYQMTFANPVEFGAANVVKFDHNFPGRAALEKIAANPKRKMVTLEWNEDDLAEIYLSQFRDAEPYKPMDMPNDMFSIGPMHLQADWVLGSKGEKIGYSSHRTFDAYFKKMLSLCAIGIDYSEIGTEVKILWGDAGTRQKEIRAKVARFPYNNHLDNKTFDTEAIPHPSFVK